MKPEELQVIIESQKILIQASIEQLQDNIKALKIAEETLKERDRQIDDLINECQWWEKSARQNQAWFRESDRSCTRYRNIIATLEAENAQCMNTDWHKAYPFNQAEPEPIGSCDSECDCGS